MVQNKIAGQLRFCEWSKAVFRGSCGWIFCPVGRRALLGGGQRDSGLDGSGMTHSRLAILPAVTHYNICYDLALGTAVISFLNPA
jgi:hypothetical protein